MRIQGLDYIIDQKDKQRLPEILAAGGGGKSTTSTVLKPPEKAAQENQARALPVTGFRTRPFLKIQDGCDAFCSYCIVPYARGRSRSASFQGVLDSVSMLSAQGFKEAVLTGIHLGNYGKDLEPRQNLFALLHAILKTAHRHSGPAQFHRTPRAVRRDHRPGGRIRSHLPSLSHSSSKRRPADSEQNGKALLS